MSGISKSPNQSDLPGDNLIKFLVSVFLLMIKYNATVLLLVTL
jgi:hypothetical protein